MWTHGYDVYTPHRPVVFHDYRSSAALFLPSYCLSSGHFSLSLLFLLSHKHTRTRYISHPSQSRSVLLSNLVLHQTIQSRSLSPLSTWFFIRHGLKWQGGREHTWSAPSETIAAARKRYSALVGRAGPAAQAGLMSYGIGKQRSLEQLHKFSGMKPADGSQLSD